MADEIARYKNRQKMQEQFVSTSEYTQSLLNKIASLEAQIKDMKSFVKSMYEANKNDPYCREYLGTILNEWEIE